MRRSELEQTKGKGEDGRASTREVKVGCIFTQHPKKGEKPFRGWRLNLLHRDATPM